MPVHNVQEIRDMLGEASHPFQLILQNGISYQTPLIVCNEAARKIFNWVRDYCAERARSGRYHHTLRVEETGECFLSENNVELVKFGIFGCRTRSTTMHSYIVRNLQLLQDSIKRPNKQLKEELEAIRKYMK